MKRNILAGWAVSGVFLSLAVSPGLAAQPATAPAAMSAAEIKELRAQALELVGPLPEKMPGSENDTKALVKLGETLYFDNRLSVNEKISCNSCHIVDKNGPGVDNEPTSEGAFGKRGGRNSPTVLNAGFHFVQFWDGRAADLEAQAKGPILNPVEMVMPSEEEVLKRLNGSKEYTTMFREAFPYSTSPVSYDNMAKAIAAFERTLVTRDRFDDFQKGKDKALSAGELAGLKLFLTTGCTTCHNGPVIGGNSFQKVGLLKPYENTDDLGRYVVTKDEDDKFKFKVPSLRNVALTHPYFHDGKIAKLEEVVRRMASMQLGKDLADPEVQSLVVFLNSLSDKKRGK